MYENRRSSVLEYKIRALNPTMLKSVLKDPCQSATRESRVMVRSAQMTANTGPSNLTASDDTMTSDPIADRKPSKSTPGSDRRDGNIQCEAYQVNRSGRMPLWTRLTTLSVAQDEIKSFDPYQPKPHSSSQRTVELQEKRSRRERTNNGSMKNIKATSCAFISSRALLHSYVSRSLILW